MLVCFVIPDISIACERSRSPRLKGSPIALVDAHDTVLVASETAQRFGIRTGQSGTRARARCRGLTLLPYDGPAYVDFVKWAWDLIAAESHSVQPISAEQCFATISGRDCAERVHRLARSITDHFGVPVQVGMGSSLNAAEQAAHRIADALAMQVAISITLDSRADLSHQAPADGAPEHVARATHAPEVMEEKVRFEEGVCEAVILDAAVRVCASRLSRRLSAVHETCSAIQLEVSFEEQPALQSSHQLKTPVCRTVDLYGCATRLLRQLTIRNPITAVRLIATEVGIGAAR